MEIVQGLPVNVNLELLYHYQCDHCKKWWTIGDIIPKTGSLIYCCHCGQGNTIEGVVIHPTFPVNINAETVKAAEQIQAEVSKIFEP